MNGNDAEHARTLRNGRTCLIAHQWVFAPQSARNARQPAIAKLAIGTGKNVNHGKQRTPKMTNKNELIRRGDAVAVILSKVESLDGQTGQSWLSADTANHIYASAANIITALPAAPMGVTVKPLEWETTFWGDDPRQKPVAVRAEPPWGNIGISYSHDGRRSTYNGFDFTQGDHLKAAKDKAQADYATRILAALTPQHAPTLGDALELLAGHVTSMDQEAFFQFAHAMDKALESHDPKLCAASLAALKGGA